MRTESIFILAGALLCGLPALAQQKGPAPAAIIEDVTGKVHGAAPLEYVEAGRTINAKDGSVVLSYLLSCKRETITGGTMVVGERESAITGGHVERADVRCDGGKLVLADAQAGKSGAMAYRGTNSKSWGRATLPSPSITIYGASPIITLTEPADYVLITRLDLSGAIITLRPAGGKVDMATEGKRLEAGGLYMAEAAGRTVVFLVDGSARPGKEPIVGRLLRL